MSPHVDAAPPQPLDGRLALVTGASSGIGRAIAIRLAASGCALALTGRAADRLRETASMLPDGTQCTSIAVDLAAAGGVETLVSALTGSSPDIVVHCAGMYLRGVFADVPPADFDSAWRTNVAPVYALTRALLPALKKSGGDIVFINSSIVGRATPTTGQFAATQAALRALADSLREQVNARGVRVMSVFPGRTATPRQARIFADEGRAYAPERLLQADDLAATVAHCVALPRTAEVTELFIRPALK